MSNEPAVKTLLEFRSKDGTRSSVVMKYETNFLVHLINGDNTQLVEYYNLYDAENKAEDWVQGVI